MRDVKNQPHYTAFKMQPIEFFMANIGCLDFLQMCAIKYICRFKLKNGLEDLDKAEQYIQYMRQQYLKDHPPAPRIPTTSVIRAMDSDRSIDN